MHVNGPCSLVAVCANTIPSAHSAYGKSTDADVVLGTLLPSDERPAPRLRFPADDESKDDNDDSEDDDEDEDDEEDENEQDEEHDGDDDEHSAARRGS